MRDVIVKEIAKEIGVAQINELRDNMQTHLKTYFQVDGNGEIVKLVITGKKIWKFPRAILNLLELKHLEIFSTGLEELPEEIAKLQHLETLILSGNQISEIPKSLSSLYSLKTIKVNGNPIETPPPEILAQGSKGIRLFLSSKSGEFQSLNEVKVIFVGDGGSGKTSILKRITIDEFDLNEKRTHGIRITDKVITYENIPYKVNYWDFGGQEIMHSTHQFFLSKRSLYLLVLDGRKEEDPEYWLKHIKTFSDSSSVLVILNKYDDNPSFDVNRKFLVEKYPNIKGFIKISCKTKFGLDQLNKYLTREISHIKHISTQWPKEWFNIKNQLEKFEKDYISYDQYQEVCSDNDLCDSESCQSLIEFLNDLGVILHFDDINLSETNVINPRWITNAVYSIINSELVSKQNGVLNLYHIKSILPSNIYPKTKYGYIVGLMKKFELCYSITDDQILLPDLLDVQEPNFKTKSPIRLRFIYKFDFVPKSILPRFIVKSNQEEHHNICWRTGIIIDDRFLNSQAVVKVDYSEKMITIDVSGDNSIELFFDC